MKMTTRRWLRMSNGGRPADTIQQAGTIREHCMTIAKWLTEVNQGSVIQITLTRTEAELDVKRVKLDADDMFAELDAMVGGTPKGEHNGSDDESNDSDHDQRPVCPHGQPLKLPCRDCRVEHERTTM